MAQFWYVRSANRNIQQPLYQYSASVSCLKNGGNKN